MSDGKLKLTVASSPHVCSPISTRHLMQDVLIALAPALCIAVYFFGPNALIMTAVSVLGCEFFEWAYRRLLQKPNTNRDLSAAVTGILLAFVCPPGMPLWILLIGDFFAIVLVKQLFGGLGQNFMNPALGARAFLMLCYPVAMTTWVKSGPENWGGLFSAADAVTAATPLSFLHPHLDAATGLMVTAMPDVSLGQLFVGNVGGCLGEVSALMLLLGGIYLIVRGVIRPRIPVAYLGTVAILTLIFSRGNPNIQWMLTNLCSGGLMLGAFFMATDYVTSPVTKRGELYFGIGCGLLTVFIRYFGGYPEGVSYAILIMNVCVWLLDKVGAPNRFGISAEAKQAAKLAKKGGAAS